MTEKHIKEHERFDAKLFEQPAEYLDNTDKALKNNEKEPTPNEGVETIRGKIDRYAQPKISALKEKISEDSRQTSHHISKKIKSETYQATLQRVRAELSPSQRLLSKAIHNKTVESISEVSAKTIARPSGILGGALFSLVGSLIIILIAKRIGFPVPASIFAILFIAGFVLGVSSETLLSPLKKTRSKK